MSDDAGGKAWWEALKPGDHAIVDHDGIEERVYAHLVVVYVIPRNGIVAVPWQTWKAQEPKYYPGSWLTQKEEM